MGPGFRRDSNRNSLEPRRGGEIARLEEFRVEELGLIAGARIGKDRDDRVTGSELASQPDRAADIDPRRAAKNKPLLLDEGEYDRQHLGIGDLILPIGREPFEVLGFA